MDFSNKLRGKRYVLNYNDTICDKLLLATLPDYGQRDTRVLRNLVDGSIGTLVGTSIPTFADKGHPLILYGATTYYHNFPKFLLYNRKVTGSHVSAMCILKPNSAGINTWRRAGRIIAPPDDDFYQWGLNDANYWFMSSAVHPYGTLSTPYVTYGHIYILIWTNRYSYGWTLNVRDLTDGREGRASGLDSEPTSGGGGAGPRVEIGGAASGGINGAVGLTCIWNRVLCSEEIHRLLNEPYAVLKP